MVKHSMKEPVADHVSKRVIQDEMKDAYMAYAMSVIVGRALPDVRDGLKPVHRRILYAMHDTGMRHNQPYKKSARIVGEVLGKYHPHGDGAVYDTLVRMVQEWSLRVPLIDGQGNFGCFTADTKVRLTDGRCLSFKELVKEHEQGKRNFTFTRDKDGLIKIAEIKHPRKTKEDAQLVKVTLDNGEEIRCTPDHRFMLRIGKYREAQNLSPGDSLSAINFRYSTSEDGGQYDLTDYEMVYQSNSDGWAFCHVLADEWNLVNEVYPRRAGRVRHHKDFEKHNNNPTNIQRMKWKEHFKLHAQHAKELHQDPEYRQKISAGREAYWADPQNREQAAKRMRERNLENWEDEEYRENMIEFLREVNIEHSKDPEVRAQRSERLNQLWQNEEFRKLVSALKSAEMTKRWQEGDATLNQFSSEQAKAIWSDPEHREFISNTMKQLWEDEEYRQRMSEQSKALWQDEEYRAQYTEDHFSQMAKKLWEDPSVRKMHQEKAKKQWENEEFREQCIQGVKQANLKRLKENPHFMEEIAQKAAESLKEKWKDPSYKEQVVGNRILDFVNKLITEHEEVSPELYEQARSGGIPRIEKALDYFDSFDDIVQRAEVYNHRVLSVDFLSEREDVYDLTIDVTHNFALAAGVFVHNSIDGDSAAAMRYTEARMAKPAQELLQDLDKETVEWADNFDGSLKEPRVLPATLPNLLVNGSAGIAVGMATNIPPHNLQEVAAAIEAYIDNPEITVQELMTHLPGPDFPTGGIICGKKGIVEAYAHGRGRIKLRGVIEREGEDRLIITEIPYQVVKADLVTQIADLVRDKRLEGIRDIRDESDRKGMRVVIELKRDASQEIVENALFKLTRLKQTFGIINLAIVDGEPKVLSLPSILQHYLDFRVQVVERRTRYDLRKAEERAHILEGLVIALKHIDDVVALTKESSSSQEAQDALIDKYDLSQEQAKAILDMKLSRLTGLEQEAIKTEHASLLEQIADFKDILAKPARVKQIIKDELASLAETYGNQRRTVMGEEEEDIDLEDLIDPEEMVVTISNAGYAKRLSLDTYQAQNRGGVGIIGAKTKDDDFVEHLFVANTHAYLLFFTNKGEVYWKKVYHIPETSRTAKGTALVNLIDLDKDERISSIIAVKEFDDVRNLVFATRKGLVKKTSLEAYSRPRSGGIHAIKLDEDDDLVNVVLTTGEDELLVASDQGQSIRFHESDCREMGRYTRGVIGMKMRDDDRVVSVSVVSHGVDVLSITEKGYGKRTSLEEYPLQGRGGMGVRNIKTEGRNGLVVGNKVVNEDDELLFITQKGIIIRTRAADISQIGRNTQGVRVMKLRDDDVVQAVARVVVEQSK